MSEGARSEDLIEELLVTSRALVGVAVRSVAAAPVDVTVAQHRLLVLLATRGPQSVGAIAEHLGVNPSNASRQCDRLQRLGLVRRTRSVDDGRVVRIELTETGLTVFDVVMERRRRELAEVVGRIPDHEVDALLTALRRLNAAAREGLHHVGSV